MSFFSNQRIEERNAQKEVLKELQVNSRKINIIHYSCESFYGHNGTPRITAICVKNTDNNSSKVFSIHLQAELENKQLCCLSIQDLDHLEKRMLDDFYKYVKTNKTSKWVHWNMRNATYGFDAIANRYRILNGKPVDIESQFRYDLSNIIYKLYTHEYIDKHGKGRLLNLADENDITCKDALIGEEEAKAFTQREYQKLSLSTSRKVDIINQILDLTINQKLKVKTPYYKIYGLSIKGIIEIVRNNWVLNLLWAVILFMLGILLEGPFKALFGIQ